MKAGFGVANLQIEELIGEEDVQLTGFIFRKKQRCEGVDERGLSVRCCIIETNGEYHVLLSYDLLAIGDSVHKLIKTAIVEKFHPKLSEKNAVLLCTHTHSAPAAIDLEMCGDVHPKFVQSLVQSSVSVVASTLPNLAENILVTSHQEHLSGVSYNRRRVLADGTVYKGVELPAGAQVVRQNYNDNLVTLVCFFTAPHSDDEKVTLLGSFVHFSCHATLCCTQTATADYPGVMRCVVEDRLKYHWNAAPSIFLQGACGDINPQAGRATDPDNLAHYGTRLTQLLTPILDRACQHMSANVKTQGSEIFCSGMESVSDSVMLQYAPLPSKEEVESEITILKKIIDGDVTSQQVQPVISTLKNLMNLEPGVPPEVSRASFACQAFLNSKNRTLQSITSSSTSAPPSSTSSSSYSSSSHPACPLSLAMWQIHMKGKVITGKKEEQKEGKEGITAERRELEVRADEEARRDKRSSIVLVFVAAEIFAETGMFIRQLGAEEGSHAVLVLPVGYSAPMVGYLPTESDCKYGGYEVDDAWKFYGHSAPFLPTSDATVRHSLTSLFTSLQ